MGKDNLTLEEGRRRAELIEDVRYDVFLDLTDPKALRSETTIAFRCREPGAATFLDLVALSVPSIELNGTEVPPGSYANDRIALGELEEENLVRIQASSPYNRTEVGMHRFEDPVDGSVYLHTHLEPFGAHRVFPCFDQPDLKGTFDFTVLGEKGWKVVSNAPAAGEPVEDGGRLRWKFAPTPPISTYVTAVCAGPFHEVRTRHRDVDLGIFCRRSLAEHLDQEELFQVTRQGFDFYEEAFGYPYMFDGKYDQLFIPESNSGAMENAAAITFNDVYIFRSRVTDAARERRAGTILHEMAHMWFGDLVTMRWWNDLWLNETFASYMSVLAQAESTRWSEAWTTFADTEKTWAYRQDQLPSTHPIVGDVPDIESIHLNFDGITYAKGASVLKQLVAWVGKDRFLQGIKAYCRRHEWGNATLDDFLGALEEASGRDLQSWSKEWLETPGVNTLRPRIETDGEDGQEEVLRTLSVLQEAPEAHPTLRSHRLAVGLYDRGEDGIVRRRRVELDIAGKETEVPQVEGEPVPDLILLNDDDLTFAKIRLDPRSLRNVVHGLGQVEDSLARTLCWTACWDMTRDAEMAPRDYLDLVVNNIEAESKIGTVQTLLAQASAAVNLYGDPARRPEAGRRLADASLEGLLRSEAGSDRQLAWARSFISSAQSDEHLGMVRGLLDGSTTFDGLVVDTELRWHIVRSLAAAGVVDESIIAAESRRDPTDRGNRHSWAARAAMPTGEAKERAWELVVHDADQPLALVDEVMAAFQQPRQEEVLTPYVDRFFDVLPEVWERKDVPDALAFGRRMYPHLAVDESTIDRTDRHLAADDVPGPIRRLLLEGKDGVARALRARAADRAAGTSD